MARSSIATLSLGLGCAFAPIPGVGAQIANADRAAIVETFNAAIQRYTSLRARLEEPLPPFDSRRDGWSLLLQRRYLASAIRTARSRALLGDTFNPLAAAQIRRDIAEAVYEIDIEGLADGHSDADLVDLTANEPIPAWAMQPAPRVLLERLPALPDAIEYRLVGDALILWDPHAEILIDAVPDALRGDE